MDWLVVASLVVPLVVIGLFAWEPFAGFIVGVPAAIILSSIWGYRADAPYREFVNKCHMAQNSVLTDEFKAAYCVDMRTVKFERFTG
jgi:hypothetical protein